MTRTAKITRAPKMAAAVAEFEHEVNPQVRARLYLEDGEWRADPVVPDVYGYIVTGTNHALAIIYADPDKILDFEIDDSIL